MAGVCHIQGAKYIKYNVPHLTINHCHFAWCCKANDKLNPSRLETKKSEPYSHSFKCLNCKGYHQADSIECPFWKHHFNKEWYSKEYTKLQKSRKNSICSTMNNPTIWFWIIWGFSRKMSEKNNLVIKTILEVNNNFNIIFIQEQS